MAALQSLRPVVSGVVHNPILMLVTALYGLHATLGERWSLVS